MNHSLRSHGRQLPSHTQNTPTQPFPPTTPPQDGLPSTTSLTNHECNPTHTPQLESAYINRSEPSLWLAFEYAEYDLYEMIKFHRDHKENTRDNPFGETES